MNDGKKLTLRQDRFVDVVVEGKVDSLADAGREAGYSKHPPSLYPRVSKLASSDKIQRAIMEREAEKADSAREIHRIAGQRLLERVRNPTASDQLLLGARKISSDEIAAGVNDQDGTITSAEQYAAQRHVNVTARWAVSRFLRQIQELGFEAAVQAYREQCAEDRARFPKLVVGDTEGRSRRRDR